MSSSPPIVLWDVDGTLLRAARAGTRSFVTALRTVAGAEWPTAKLDFGGRTDPKIAEMILEAAGCDVTLRPALLAEVEAEYARRDAEFAADTRALAGVVDTIGELDRHGVIQGIVTGNIVAVARERVWIIGDTRRDLACAQANGVRCALVATGTTPFETLAALGADITVASLDAPEVADLVELIVAPAASLVGGEGE